MLVAKPTKNHVYICRLDHTLNPYRTSYKNIANSLNKFRSEPGFKICQFRVTDFEIITLPVENHEEDHELQKQNRFLKCRPYSNREKNAIVEFLDELKELLSKHQLWNPVIHEDDTLLFKLEGDIYVKGEQSGNYELYNDENGYDSLSELTRNHKTIYLNLLLYRMCDLVTQKFCWAACQTGVKLF